MLDFAWNGSAYRYKRVNEIPTSIRLADENGTMFELCRNEPTTSLEGLGVYLQPAGSDDDQFKYMMDNIDQWLKQVLHSSLPPSLNFTALHSRILRRLHYPLAATCLTPEQCRAMEVKLYSRTLPRCGISSKLPLAMRYCPRRFMGLAIPEFITHQDIQHTFELLSSYDTNNTMAQQLQVSIELIHLLIGTQNWIFDQIDNGIIDMIDNSWVKSTWEYIITHNFTIKTNSISFQHPRAHDKFIMEHINELPISRMDKTRLNSCRVYLQILTLSDMADAGGTQLMENALKGRRDPSRPSNLNWPTQGRPCEYDWHLWRYHITRMFSRPRSRLLVQPLGRWITSTHQTWEWWFHNDNRTVYHQQGNTCVRYILAPNRRRNTRSHSEWYKHQNIVIGQLHLPLMKCTVQLHNADLILLQSVSRQHNHPLPPFINIPATLEQTLAPYFHFRYYSDDDDGSTISKLF